MLTQEHSLHRVKAGGGDYVYQPLRHYHPDMVAYCPHCWDRSGIRMALPLAGESGVVICYSCRSFTQLHTPIDFETFYALED